ncbi:MAG: hypothetical protein JO191_02020 [Mycobacteriaceae bacterium]|nr:hypothetical protein [Mycobacteriaceae bacterium]MBV9515608.1 hypothetical protein [Mycobacteriaceae bacterium]
MGTALALAAPAHADPPIYPPSYGSSGVYGVGTRAQDGLTAFIPPGIYRVDEAPGIFKAPGFWLRCNATPCAPTFPGHIIARGDVSQDTSLVGIPPTDAAVYLYNVTLTVVS